MKIAILGKGFEDWGGGIDFVRHIAAAIIESDCKNEHQKYILLSRSDSRYFLTRFLSLCQGLVSGFRNGFALGRSSRRRFDESYMRGIFKDFQDLTLEFPGSTFNSHFRYARENRIHVMLPCIEPVPSKHCLTWIGYLYDFQHKYFPQYFTMEELAARDCAFSRMLQEADHVIVNSLAVKLDAEKFFKTRKAKIHVLPFSPSPQESWLIENRDLRKKYGVDRPYFIICNQFWLHKDHTTAFRAFLEFNRECGYNYQLVCTGDTEDFRSPGYYRALMMNFACTESKSSIKVLGHIPKLDQIALLKTSIATIQPTLFEGGPGGGSSYDTISLGKPLIVSDIPVNREIEKDDRVFFFEAGNFKSLAEIMKQVVSMNFVSLSNSTLRERGAKYRRSCGDVLLGIVAESCR